MNIRKLIKKFNHIRRFNKKNYRQIAHEGTKTKAKGIAEKARKENYNARVFDHKEKGDPHFDVYVRKKRRIPKI